MTRNRGFLLCAFLFSLSALLSNPAWGQTSTSLRGTVTDPSGGVVVGAKVTLTNTGTDVSRARTTGADGGYLFEALQVGTYKLTVEQAGFATYLHTGIVLELNQFGRLDLQLKLGQSTETVEVKADVVQVDTTSATLGKVENQRMIQDLPLLDRDTLQLGLLQAGVFAPDQGDTSGNPFSVSGQRSESLTFLLDGANNTDFLGNNIVVSPNPDAVQEFKILTNNYSAEYGRTSGGIVNQITKSGTNSFHGDGFEFLRNTVLNARDYFLPESEPKSTFQRNVFGGTFGGPIKKDKTFFFLAYQGARRREGEQSPQITVPSEAERTGDFSELCSTFAAGACTDPNGTQLFNPITGDIYPNNQVPVNSVIANILSKGYIPLPNLPNNGFISSPTKATDEDQGIVHVDHNWGTHDTFSFVYLVDDVRIFDPFLGGVTGIGDVPQGSGGSTNYRDQIGNFSWVHVFSGGKLNEFRFAGNRTATAQAIPADRTTPAELGYTNISPDDPNGAAPPAIFTPNFNMGPSVQGPTTLHNATFQWADVFTWTRGKHEWKFGIDISRVRQNYYYDYYNNGGFEIAQGGSWTGDAQADFIGGFWTNFYQNSRAAYGLRTGAFSGFVQDTWKVLPRLTLNIGVRYDYYLPIHDIHNEILGFFPGQQSQVFPGAPPDILYPGDPGTPNNALVYPDYNNFAPRLGFAWDMFGTGKLVMRGGFGIFYDIEDGALNLQFGGLPPFGGVTNITPFAYDSTSPFVPGTDTMANPSGSFGQPNIFPFTSDGTFGIPAISYAYVANPHFRTPYSENFNYGFQWQATRNTMVEADYVGSLGRKLISTAEVNFPVPSVMMQQQNIYGAINPECARPLSACAGGGTDDPIDPSGSPTGAQTLNTNFSNGLSDSNQFQLTVEQRFNGQFGFRAAYTAGKTNDLTSGFRSRSSTYTDPLDYRLDEGLADFDVPQRLVFSGIWALPFDRHVDNAALKKIVGGWQLNGIVTFQKGQPFTLYSNLNSSNQNNYLDRPDVLAPTRYVNPRAQTTADPTTANCVGSTDPITGNYWFDPSSYDCVNVAPFTFGTLGRNALRGPGINNFDISLTKTTHITESKSVEFRAEFFNAFNHAQFLNPDGNGYDATFGQISTDRGPRLIQFGLKLYF